MALTTGLICAVVAILVGAWRANCSFWEQYLSSNCPFAWRQSNVVLGTWIIVTATSVWAAIVGADMLVDSRNCWGWWAYLLLFLGLRWFISGQLGIRKGGYEYLNIRHRREVNQNLNNGEYHNDDINLPTGQVPDWLGKKDKNKPM